MTVGVCITTRHRPELLEQCLTHIERSTLHPMRVVVSDDSSKPEMIEGTQAVVQRFPRVSYVRGPRRGVCANRNNALAALHSRGHLAGHGNGLVGTPAGADSKSDDRAVEAPPIDHVAFLDDDALVEPDYFARAQRAIDAAPPERRAKLIVSGVRIDLRGERTTPCRLNFRGYFERCERTEVAGASYAVYPTSFFDTHRWDEQIYFGYEDAELSLRALRDGYDIVHCEDMVLTDAGRDQSTLLSEGGKVDTYGFSGEAARLYVGVKRFKDIEQSLPKLAAFVPLFFAQVSYSLAKRGSLSRLPELVRLSKVSSLVRRG